MSVSKKTLIVSTVGISAITNHGDRDYIFKDANLVSESAGDNDAKNRIEAAKENALKQLEKANSARDHRVLSAEINALHRLIYDEGINKANTHHILIHTHTWIGEESAELVKSWLELHKIKSVERVKIRDLSTDSMLSFRSGITELVKYCATTMKGWREQGYTIIFNLAGGFKGVQGVMHLLALLYADESVYIFQSADELLRIPRLPIKLELKEMVLEHFNLVRQLLVGDVIPIDIEKVKRSGISSLMYEEIDHQAILSPWGVIIWNEHKYEVISKALIEPLTQKLAYSDAFKKAINALQHDRIALINERLIDLEVYLHDSKRNPSSLNFKKLTGKHNESTHECYAWSDQDAKRIFGHFEDDQFVIDCLHKHL